MVPVMDTESNVSYKNVYCALCNNVTHSHMLFWNLRLKCHTSANMELGDIDVIPVIAASKNCELTFQTPHFDLQGATSSDECYFPMNTCNVTRAWSFFDKRLQMTCKHSRLGPLIWKGIAFKNEECVKCNGFTNIHYTTGFWDYPSSYDRLFSAWLYISYDLFLAKFNNISRDDTCTPRPLNSDNKIQNQCLETRCSPLRHKHNGTCKKRLRLLETYSYRICLRLAPRSQLTLMEAVHAWYHLHGSLIDFLGNIVRFHTYEYRDEIILFSSHPTAAISVPSHDDVVNSQFLYYDWRMKLQIKDLDPEDNLNRLRLFVENSDWVIPTDGVTYAFDAMLKDYVNEEYTIVTTSHECMSESPWSSCDEIDWNLTQLTTSPPTQRIALGFGEYYPNSYMFYNGPISTERNILEMRDCVFVRVTQNETQWTDTGFGLKFPHSGVLLSYMDFVFGDSNEIIWMCTEKYLKMFEGFLQDTNYNGEKDVHSSAYLFSVTYYTLLCLLCCASYII